MRRIVGITRHFRNLAHRFDADDAFQGKICLQG